MAQFEKLLNRIKELSKDMRFAELRKVLEHFGYTMYEPRSGSSHYTFRKKGCSSITIPKNEPINRAYVRLVRDIVLEETDHEKDD